MQFVTPWVFQKMDVRPPIGTDAGTAQISTFGGIAGVVLVATVAGAAVVFGFLVCWSVTAGGGGGVPT